MREARSGEYATGGGGLFDRRPDPIGSAEAAAVLAAHFGRTGRLDLLTSERDQNFRLVSADGSFVLKISHPAEAEAVLRRQNAALEAVAAADPALAVPRLVKGLDGQALAVATFADGSRRMVRLLTWLDGRLLHEADPGPSLLFDLGRSAARLDLALAGVEAETEAKGQEHLLWSFDSLVGLRPLLAHLDAEAARLAEPALDAFEAHAWPRFAALRGGLVHNDLNPHNVVIDESGRHVAGLLDFGDLCRAPWLAELAIAACYHVRSEAPLSGVAACTAGYDSLCPLDAEEIRLLPALVRARHAMTLLITGWRATIDPANRAYILRNAPRARSALAAWAAMENDEVAEAIVRACAAGARP